MFNAVAFSKKGSRKGLVIDSLTAGCVGVWWYEFCGDVQMFDVVVNSVKPAASVCLTDGMIVLADSSGALFEISYAAVF